MVLKKKNQKKKKRVSGKTTSKPNKSGLYWKEKRRIQNILVILSKKINYILVINQV